MSKTCRKSRRWEDTVLRSMPSNHRKNGFTMKRKATAISMNGINRRTAEFYVAPNNKSYYHRFTTINFSKPSWRALRTMIFSVTNPTDFVDWLEAIHKMWSCSFWTQPQKVVGYHRETHHFSEGKSAKEFTAPQHTRFILPPIHPTKSSLRCVGGIFLFHK